MAIRQYIGARYVPRFMGQYDATQIYDALDVVDNGTGTSYIARKTVPAGTPLIDTDYWFVYGAASGAIFDLQNRMTQAENDIIKINDNIDVLPPLYDSSVTYATYDYVVYNGGVYQAIAPSTGILPTNASYWVSLGDIQHQFENFDAELDLKAAKSAFTPTAINLGAIDFSTYGSLTLDCKQIGMMIVLSVSMAINQGVNTPANLYLNTIPIPAVITENLNFYADCSNQTDNIRMIIGTNGMLRIFEAQTAGRSAAGQIILPAANWI